MGHHPSLDHLYYGLQADLSQFLLLLVTLWTRLAPKMLC